MSNTYRKNWYWGTETQYVEYMLQWNQERKMCGLQHDSEEECVKDSIRDYRRRRSHSATPSFKFYKRKSNKQTRQKYRLWLKKGRYDDVPYRQRKHHIWDYY